MSRSNMIFAIYITYITPDSIVRRAWRREPCFQESERKLQVGEATSWATDYSNGGCESQMGPFSTVTARVPVASTGMPKLLALNAHIK